MKAHLAKLSLALLSTVFLLGCQDIGSGPVGLDGPQFNKPVEVTPENKTACEATLGFFFDEKGHCHAGEEPLPPDDGDNPGSPFYDVTFAGGITTFSEVLSETETLRARAVSNGASGGNNQSRIGLHGCPEPFASPCTVEELRLGVLLGGVFDEVDVAACFDDGTLVGQFLLHDERLLTGEWMGNLFPSKEIIDGVEVRFLFDAEDKDLNPISYRLTLDGFVHPDDNGDLGDGIFPPEVGEAMTVTFTTFSIGAQRTREKNACSHTGGVGTPTSVLLLGVDPDLTP